MNRKKRRSQDEESTPRSRSGGKDVSALGVLLSLTESLKKALVGGHEDTDN